MEEFKVPLIGEQEFTTNERILGDESPPNQYAGPPTGNYGGNVQLAPTTQLSYAQKAQHFANMGNQQQPQHQPQQMQFQQQPQYQQPPPITLAPGQYSISWYPNGISVGMSLVNGPSYDGLPDLSYSSPEKSGPDQAKDGIAYNVNNSQNYGPNVLPLGLTEKYYYKTKPKLRFVKPQCKGLFPTTIPPFIELQQRISADNYKNIIEAANGVMKPLNETLYKEQQDNEHKAKFMMCACFLSCGLCCPFIFFYCCCIGTKPSIPVPEAIRDLNMVLERHDQPGLKIRAVKAKKQERERRSDDSEEYYNYFWNRYETIELRITLE